MATYDNCYKCKKGLECGWSNIEPSDMYKLDVSKMVDEPCENLCEPSEFTSKDLNTEVTIRLLKAVADNAKDSFENSIKRKRAAEEKIKALRQIVENEEKNMDEVRFFLPRGARRTVGKTVKEHYENMDTRHRGSTEAYISKLEAEIAMLEAEILDLTAERRAILDSLTSCVASFSLAPGGASDPHAYDDYVSITAELDSKIEEVVHLNAKINRAKKLASLT